MKKLSKKAVNTSRGIMIVMVSVMGTITLAACSINYSELAEGINELGEGVDKMVNGSTVVTTADETEPTESATESSAEVTEETTPTPTPSPTPTPKPTATPTPMPQRVDFSELTTDSISEAVEVQREDFAESYHADGEETELVTFTGNRMVVSIPGAENVQTAINLSLDGFYNEAEGLYSRYCSEADAAYGLDQEMYLAAPYSINMNYAYSYNERLLSVVMDYEVVQGGEDNITIVDRKEEIATYDILTGQYINNAMIAKDRTALEAALANAVAFAATNEDNIYTAAQVTEPVIVVHSQSNGMTFAEAYGYINGRLYHSPVDMANYADYLNTYGKIVYKIN